jgi:RNA polymerase sigma-70 factor (ECF subfamily)
LAATADALKPRAVPTRQRCIVASDERYSGDFDALFEQHSARVLAYATRRTAVLADAEDAVAETFVIAWRKLDDAPDQPLPWLLAICRRVLANQRRAAQSRSGLMKRLRALASRPYEAPTPPDSPAFDALAALKPEDKEILQLVAWDGLDHAEIATVLGISVNAVAIRVHRARGRLRAAVTTAEEEKLKGSPASATYDEWRAQPPRLPERTKDR